MVRRKGDRKTDDEERSHKKHKLSFSDTASQSIASSVQPPPPNPQANRPTKAPSIPDSADVENSKEPKRRLRKLVPPRPWSINPSNTTGPRSARQCKNYISLTRKTVLGAYLRRCKNLILDDGYTVLYLTAMGAAIPHLMHLACILPGILPFPRDEIRVNVTTGSVDVQDEIVPEDLEEDVMYKTRCKSTLKVVISVGKLESRLSARVVGEPEQELPDMI